MIDKEIIEQLEEIKEGFEIQKTLGGGSILLNEAELSIQALYLAIEIIKNQSNKIDYDVLLDSWADKVFAKAEEADSERDGTMSFKDGYYKGLYEAYVMSEVLLIREEDLANNKIQRFLRGQNK